MKLYQCISVFKPVFLTSIFEIKQNHLAEKVCNWGLVNFVETFKVIVGRWKQLQENSHHYEGNISILVLHFTMCFLHADSFFHIQLMEAKQIQIPVSKYLSVTCLQCKCALDICWIPLTGLQTPCMSWSAHMDCTQFMWKTTQRYLSLCTYIVWTCMSKNCAYHRGLSSSQPLRSWREKFLPSGPTGTEYV